MTEQGEHIFKVKYNYDEVIALAFTGLDVTRFCTAQRDADEKALNLDREKIARLRHSEREGNITWVPWEDLTFRKQAFYLGKADRIIKLIRGNDVY